MPGGGSGSGAVGGGGGGGRTPTASWQVRTPSGVSGMSGGSWQSMAVGRCQPPTEVIHALILQAVAVAEGEGEGDDR